jgi:hypothetical protein
LKVVTPGSARETPDIDPDPMLLAVAVSFSLP